MNEQDSGVRREAEARPEELDAPILPDGWKEGDGADALRTGGVSLDQDPVWNDPRLDEVWDNPSWGNVPATEAHPAEQAAPGEAGPGGTAPGAPGGTAQTAPDGGAAGATAPVGNSGTGSETASASGTAVRNGRNLREEVELARRLYPDMREIPGEVSAAVAAGSGFLDAYGAWRTRETARELEALRRENEVLRHNQDTLRRAPVTGVSGGGAAAEEAEDDFLRGFNYDRW